MTIVKVVNHLHPDALTEAHVVIVMIPYSSPDILASQLSLPLHYYIWRHWYVEGVSLPWLAYLSTPCENRIEFEREFADRFNVKLSRHFKFYSLCSPLVDICFFHPETNSVEEMIFHVHMLAQGFARHADVIVVAADEASLLLQDELQENCATHRVFVKQRPALRVRENPRLERRHCNLDEINSVNNFILYPEFP